ARRSRVDDARPAQDVAGRISLDEVNQIVVLRPGDEGAAVRLRCDARQRLVTQSRDGDGKIAGAGAYPNLGEAPPAYVDVSVAALVRPGDNKCTIGQGRNVW